MPEKWVARLWSPSRVFMERISAILLVHRGDLGEMLAHPDPRNGSVDLLEFSTVGVARLEVERIRLARPAIHPQQDAGAFPLWVARRLRSQERHPGAKQPAASNAPYRQGSHVGNLGVAMFRAEPSCVVLVAVELLLSRSIFSDPAEPGIAIEERVGIGSPLKRYGIRILVQEIFGDDFLTRLDAAESTVSAAFFGDFGKNALHLIEPLCARERVAMRLQAKGARSARRWFDSCLWLGPAPRTPACCLRRLRFQGSDYDSLHSRVADY